MPLDQLVGSFEERFAQRPAGACRAPGRVNLIGEHTDYSGGLVMPLAVNRDVTVLWARHAAACITVYSRSYGERVQVDLPRDTPPARQGHWSDYVAGVAWQLAGAGVAVGGCALLVESRIPVGVGLASSAAFCVAVAGALLAVSGLALDPTELARRCQAAEQAAAGVECGIMDQFAATLARRGTVLWIDCASEAFEHLPLDESGASIVVSDSGTRHRLAEGGYNTRPRELAQALALLQAQRGVADIRALHPADFAAVAQGLPSTLERRARHVVEENWRVEQAAAALKRDDLERVGELMLESHDSLRLNYEVSTPELDALVEAAKHAPGVLGAKLTGAGFGGATVNLVRAGEVGAFMSAVATEYRRRTGRESVQLLCSSADGVSSLLL